MIEQHWTNLIRPDAVKTRVGEDPNRYATLTIEPLERGFGLTLGNALRRVLISSLRGAAVTMVQIDGVPHEFSSLPGVREDVTDIVLNVKRVAVKMQEEGPRKVSLQATGPCEVTAGDIRLSAGIEVLNPNQPICHLDEGVEFYMELTVSQGKGYEPAEKHRNESTPINAIVVDAIFSPVRNVAYHVEPTREGQVLDYDKLVLDVETNGAIVPEDAVAYAARILQDQLSVFVNFEDAIQRPTVDAISNLALDPRLRRKVDDLGLSARAINCLKNDNIVYIGDLLLKSESEMLATPNFGRKSLDEIKSSLDQMGLELGTEIPGWPPDDLATGGDDMIG